RLARLGARVVELGGLADDYGPRPEDQDLAWPRRLPHAGHRPDQRRAVADHLEEPVVQVLVVLRAGTAFGVVLDAERGQPPVAEALDRAVVQVALGDVEVPGGDGPGIDLELVVLARDVDSTVVEVLDR